MGQPFAVGDRVSTESANLALLAEADPEVAAIAAREAQRQENTLGLIASENYVSQAVLAALGTSLTNKYAEGTPCRRWYNGCSNVNAVEALAAERACRLFGADHANVQPHAGSQANAAAYLGLLDLGDRILSMDLNHGGHLTHGSPLSFSGKSYAFAHYGVDPKTAMLDYGRIEAQALEFKPRALVVGASSYPRTFDFPRLREIANRVGAYLIVDIAHIAGLIAGGAHPSPVPYADVVTSTTHKTLRGPRGGFILCKKTHARAIDRAVFPGIQGGPLPHVMAAKAVAFGEALTSSFSAYAHQIVNNAAAMADALQRQGLTLVSGGTDNHLMLVDVTKIGLTGRDAANMLEEAGIVANKNVIPFDSQSPLVTSGIRLGTPAVTTRGFREAEVVELAEMITRVLKSAGDEQVIAEAKVQVAALCRAFPTLF